MESISIFSSRSIKAALIKFACPALLCTIFLGVSCKQRKSLDSESKSQDVASNGPALPTVEEFSKVTTNPGRLHQNISPADRYNVIKGVRLEMAQSAPGHNYLRDPEKAVGMGKAIAASPDRGLAMFKDADKMVLNVFTNAEAKVTGIEVMDGNHRFAAGIYAEILAPGKGWKTIGNIPQDFLEIRVNGFNTQGQKLIRWIPLDTVKQGNFPRDSWKEIPQGGIVKGPTAEVAGDLSSTDPRFKPEHRGVSLLQVLRTSLKRAGVNP